MPYSERKNAVFIWIPKTAGTSLANVFKQRGVFRRNGREDLWGRIPEEERERRSASNWQHISAIDAREEIGRERWDECFKFTFVRHPYDRIVSFYEYSKAARKDPKSVQYGQPDPGDFDQWLDEDQPPGQLHYINDEEGNSMVDFVAKYESLQRDLLTICFKLRIWPMRVPTLNASERRDYRSYFTPEIRKRVDALCGEEMEAFGYEY